MTTLVWVFLRYHPRANRDKESLEAKLHRGSAGIIKQHAVPLLAAPPSGKELHGIEELRKHNFELEQEVDKFHLFIYIYRKYL